MKDKLIDEKQFRLKLDKLYGELIGKDFFINSTN